MILLFFVVAIVSLSLVLLVVSRGSRPRIDRLVLTAAAVTIIGSILLNLRAGLVADSQGITGQMAGGELGWAFLGLGLLLVLVVVGRATLAKIRPLS
jgi:hypothetical protein